MIITTTSTETKIIIVHSEEHSDDALKGLGTKYIWFLTLWSLECTNGSLCPGGRDNAGVNPESSSLFSLRAWPNFPHAPASLALKGDHAIEF